VPQLGENPYGNWTAPFLREIEPLLANARHQSNYAPLGVTLAVAIPDEVPLLTDHPLYGFLGPLVSALSLPQLKYAAATKAHGKLSTLCIGPVGQDFSSSHEWQNAAGHIEGLSVRMQRMLGHQIATQVTPTRWGAVELDIAVRTGIMRDWVEAWKPLIESLVAIVGRRREDVEEFEIETGRIVKLALHHDVNALLGDAIQVDVRARLLERRMDGPPLDYDVRDDTAITRRG